MATTIRSGGLQHAASLGNIEVSAKANSVLFSGRSYDSEDESMGRRKVVRSSAPGQFPKSSVYSKGDIIEQYCLSDKQLNSVERPRRERFFGCWSGRGTPQSFLGVCVGRRAPSDENLPDYAPIYKYPRYPPPGAAPKDVLQYDEELESSYFRRRPTSFLSGGDPKRYTWMPADEEAVRLEGPRPISSELDSFNRGPYVVGSYPPSSYLAQSTEQLAGLYRCPAHVGLPPPPPPPHIPLDGTMVVTTPRIKHVSFARSHTLTSFDEAMGMRSLSRMGTARSQERLIGGKKATLNFAPTQMLVAATTANAAGPTLIQMAAPAAMMLNADDHLLHAAHDQVVVVEKLKRGAMKTQATQTEMCLGKRMYAANQLSLSPRTIHRVKMVSQGAQTNGGLNGRKLTKSLSEVGGVRLIPAALDHSSAIEDEPISPGDHEPLQRTQSEEPPRSPYTITPGDGGPAVVPQSRTSSRQSEIETSRSEIIYSTSDNAASYSRNLSQDSVGSIHSTDVFTSKASQDSLSTQFGQTNSPGPSAELQEHAINYSPHYDSHSLPRRMCGHQREEMEFHTHSLPRRDHHQHQMHHQTCKHSTPIDATLHHNGQDTQIQIVQPSRRPSAHLAIPIPAAGENTIHRRASHSVTQPEMHTVFRRSSMQPQVHTRPSTPSDEMCSTCESSSESDEDAVNEHNVEDEEQEIFIDFKPRMSPTPSPSTLRRKKLQKTLSEGEILSDKSRHGAEPVALTTASEEDLKTPEKPPAIVGAIIAPYMYRNAPIQDEGICEKQHLLAIPHDAHVDVVTSQRYSRESFRKRSVSLEDSTVDGVNVVAAVKSAPPSPLPEELSIQVHSPFPSSDSLANDVTRDHSDGGIWNESQATVLPAELSPLDPQQPPALLTPSTRRKHLLLQHQQRSSMDTEAIDLEELLADQALLAGSRSDEAAVTEKRTSVAQRHRQAAIVEAMVHAPPIHRLSVTLDPLSAMTEHLNRSDSGKTNTDISECSTNTEDYATCTDNSKRGGQGIKSSGPSSSSTQMPVSAPSSQTVTQDGSSFESASSMYSLARAEAICEDVPPATEQHQLQPVAVRVQPPQPVRPIKIMPPHYSPPSVQLHQRPVLSKATQKSESLSDDDRSHHRYSSGSGYYESPQDEILDVKPVRSRRAKEWNEDDRRRRKGTLKLDFDNGSPVVAQPKSGITPIYKQISPDDRTGLNILDGTSPNKAKRIRPKGRRPGRVRSTSGDDTLMRRVKTNLNCPDGTAPRLSPPKFVGPPPNSCGIAISARTQKALLSPDKKLKAISSESLRSVSPGSDSVFYSEADGISEQQVHCHHCGKEVEIVTAAGGSQDSIVAPAEYDRPDIVQPPAGFADSPDGPRTPHSTTRLYKKWDKRFRSEERHTDRRHFRSRQDTRAKSEERGKEEVARASILRPAGSSPCVMPPDGALGGRDRPADPEQGIYHGFYRLGTWICITDNDVWRRNDNTAVVEGVRFSDRPRDIAERRCSTDSEKDFRKKYQAITHRLVHRKSCVEMYRRQSSNAFNASIVTNTNGSSQDSLRRKLEDLLKLMLVVWAKQGQAIKLLSGEPNDTDKTIIVQRKSGEFGFRIHGSKPVVVSAIEPDTPAESSGLEVGDIVLAVNGVSVVDKNHSEVVKIAHAGSDTLELEVARTIGVLSPGSDGTTPALYSGYLWRQGGHASGNPTALTKWTRRWFSLRPDHCLYYYKADSDTQPVGAVLLTNHTVECCPATESGGRSFAFRIDGGDGPPLLLAADSDEAASRWVAVMSHASKQTDPWLEVSTRNLRLAPGSVPRPDCFGYLMKLGSRWRAWSKRYCVLKDACLYFYQDGSSKNAFGMACLQGYRVQPSSTAGGKKHTFEIAPPESKLRHYYFSTESEMDKKRWVAALEYSIDRWMKAG